MVLRCCIMSHWKLHKILGKRRRCGGHHLATSFAFSWVILLSGCSCCIGYFIFMLGDEVFCFSLIFCLSSWKILMDCIYLCHSGPNLLTFPIWCLLLGSSLRVTMPRSRSYRSLVHIVIPAPGSPTAPYVSSDHVVHTAACEGLRSSNLMPTYLWIGLT